MAEQRQPFRFRLPWLPAPQPTPAAPRPSQATQAPPQPAPAQRPPFRPAGVAPAQLPTRAESQPPSQSRTTSRPPAQPQGPKPSQAPQASPTHTPPQTQFISPARRASPQTQPARPRVSATPTPKPSEAAPQMQPEAKPQSSTKKPSSQEPKNQVDIQGPETKGSTELATRVSAPEPEVYQTASEGHTRILKGMNHEELKEKKTHSQVLTSTAKPKGHPLAMQDEQVQHPSEEVFDRKEVTETVRNSVQHTLTDINGNEKVGRFPHKAIMPGEKPTLPREMREGSQRFPHKLGAKGDKHPVQEKPFSIITLSGDNKGATMHLSSESAKRERSIHIHRGYKTNPDKSVDTATDGEGSSGGRKSGDSKLQEELATKLYVNNNAQGVNNSLVFNSSVTDRNPGVHVVCSCNSEGPIKPGKERETVQTRKAEVASTTAKKLAYTPTIRRRCLRGLLLESSDSDPENPEKPRRHGCRVGCDQMRNDENIDVL